MLKPEPETAPVTETATEMREATEPAAAEPTPKPAGVRPNQGRLYWAGRLLARDGLEPGITAEQVAEIDELLGTSHPIQTRYDLSAAWHVIHGYLEGLAEATEEQVNPTPLRPTAPSATFGRQRLLSAPSGQSRERVTSGQRRTISGD